MNYSDDILRKLSVIDRELIIKHYVFYEKLETGKFKAETEAQKRFVNVCIGVTCAYTEHEKAYLAYIKIRDENYKYFRTPPFSKKNKVAKGRTRVSKGNVVVVDRIREIRNVQPNANRVETHREMLQRYRERQNEGGIPQYEEGAPRGIDGIGGTREDCKKLKNWKS